MAQDRKCLIRFCPRFLCGECHRWIDPRKDPKHHCEKRPPPSRALLKTCPQCRQGMYYWEDATYEERDERHQFVKMLDARFTYSDQHPRRPLRRKEKQARTTRATNAAPNIRSV
jgi:hypothetical protein